MRLSGQRSGTHPQELRLRVLRSGVFDDVVLLPGESRSLFASSSSWLAWGWPESFGTPKPRKSHSLKLPTASIIIGPPQRWLSP